MRPPVDFYRVRKRQFRSAYRLTLSAHGAIAYPPGSSRGSPGGGGARVYRTGPAAPSPPPPP